MIRRTLLVGLAALVFCLVILPTILVRGCAPARTGLSGLTVALYLGGAKKVVRLGLEDYLVGVVAAEMPARFSTEALKAQAVAARTLTIKRMRSFGGRGCSHSKEADLCDQPGDGQAWLSESDLRRAWGWRYSGFQSKIARAVAETRGLVLLYEHRPIDAVYHSTCGGTTEDAALVWGHRIPYLQSVVCGYDSFSPRYRTRVKIARDEFLRRLGLKPSGRTALALHILGRSPSGRVTSVSVAGKVFTGSAFRQAVGLRSADFSYALQGNNVIFTVKGYGHGVGLCQYGAEGMARKGADYAQILKHYYRGVTMGRLKE